MYRIQISKSTVLKITKHQTYFNHFGCKMAVKSNLFRIALLGNFPSVDPATSRPMKSRYRLILFFSKQVKIATSRRRNFVIFATISMRGFFAFNSGK